MFSSEIPWVAPAIAGMRSVNVLVHRVLRYMPTCRDMNHGEQLSARVPQPGWVSVLVLHALDLGHGVGDFKHPPR